MPEPAGTPPEPRHDVVVVGGGAVGSFLAATLGSAGHDVTIVTRRAAASGGRRRIEVVDPRGASRSVEVGETDGASSIAGAPDLVVLAVKMPDLAGALSTAAAWPTASLLLFQTGLGAEEGALEAGPGGRLVAGSLTTPVAMSGDTVERLARGGIGLADVRGGHRASLQELVGAFEAGGLRARAFEDAAAMRWSKLLANLMANATSAILDLDPSDVFADRSLFAVERRQLREALAVMRRLGLRPVGLPGADVRPLAIAARLPAGVVRPILRRVVRGGRGGKSPSLRLSLQAGPGPTEVDWLQGAVAREARRLGLRAPVNERLAAIVQDCSEDPGRWAWFRGRGDRLLAALSAEGDHD